MSLVQILPLINSSVLRRLRIQTPPLPEQRRIARILTTVDEVIERTEALKIAKYQAIKQGLLHDLLTRGVDARGRLHPAPRQEAPALYKESPLGWIPKKWNVTTLGKTVADGGGFIQTGPFGSQLHSHEYVDNGVAVIMPQDINEVGISEEKIVYITTQKAHTLSAPYRPCK